MIRPVLSPDENPLLIPVENIEPTKNISLIIFPNPSDAVFNLDCENCIGENYSIKVHNSLGQQVLQKEFTNQLDLGTFPNGLYFISLYDNQKAVVSQRILKK
jgi:hypothetical protein